MRYLIDTCVISELSARKPAESVRRWFGSVSDEDLYLSVVTIGELRKGIDRLSADNPRKQKLEAWFSAVRQVFSGRIIGFDERAAIAWGSLVGEAMRAGQVRPMIDAQLAATALVNGMVLVTRNERDFAHTKVKVLNPFVMTYDGDV